MTLLKLLKTMFAGKEVEIIVKSIEPGQKSKHQEKLVQTIEHNSINAPS